MDLGCFCCCCVAIIDFLAGRPLNEFCREFIFFLRRPVQTLQNKNVSLEKEAKRETVERTFVSGEKSTNFFLGLGHGDRICVCEKKTPKSVAQPVFCQNGWMHNVYRGKKKRPNSGKMTYFGKNFPKYIKLPNM
jgi:hypothetical protein